MFISKASHNKWSDNLYNFLNKMSGQTCGKKSWTNYNLESEGVVLSLKTICLNACGTKNSAQLEAAFKYNH